MQKPNYYAIIPAEVRYSKKLTPNAKLLYAEITALSNKDNVCWASNKYFSNLYNVSTVTISRWISSLVKNNFIIRNIIYIKGTKEIDKRYLQLCSEGINNIDKTPINKIVKDNITSINTTSNNNIEGKPSSLDEVNNYFLEKNFDLSEAINFFEYYENNGWKQGKNKMKKWKLAANRWMRNYKPKQKQGLASQYGFSINTQKQIS